VSIDSAVTSLACYSPCGGTGAPMLDHGIDHLGADLAKALA